MNKIAFVGGPGTGKTSIILAMKDQLSEQGFKVEYVEEAARKCPFKLDEGGDFASQFFMISTQINEENLAALNKPDVLLTDRCALDSLVYWNLLYEFKLKEAQSIEDEIERDKKLERLQHENAIMRQTFRSWIRDYDLIVFVRIKDETWRKRKQILDDGFRSTDFDWFKQVDNEFEKIIKAQKIVVTELWNDNSVEQTVEKAYEMVENIVRLQRTRFDYEVEVKYKIDPEKIKQVRPMLEEKGFESQGVINQKDIYFNDVNGFLPRIRKEGNTAIFNLKGESVWTEKAKIRREIEATLRGLGEAEKLEEILKLIGLKRIVVVEKTREEFVKDNITICLDDVKGLGKFLEIEVIEKENNKAEEIIDRTAKVLGLTSPVRDNYYKMILNS